MTPSPSDPRARGIAMRQARLARISGIRRRVVASALALFVATWLLITMLLISGHDPALARTRTVSAATPVTATTTGSTPTTTTSVTTRTSGTVAPASTAGTASPSTSSASTASSSAANSSASSSSPSALTSSES